MREKLGRVRPVSAAEAAAKIEDGQTLVVGGAGYRMVAEAVLAAIEARFLETGHPRNLRVISLAVSERTRKAAGASDTGLSRLAHPGLMAEVICSSFSRGDSPLNRLIASNGCVALGLPMGTIAELLRAAGAGRRWHRTEVGLGSFVDPRIDGGYLTAGKSPVAPELRQDEEGEYLAYRVPRVDVALVKGTSIDGRGNLFADKEGYLHSAIYAAMAAHNSGGIVIAQATRAVAAGSIHPRFGAVPAPLLDYAVVDPEVFSDEHEATTNGETRVVLPDVWDPSDVKMRIARTLLDILPEDACVNVGAGIGMYELPEVARHFGRGDLYFTIEQGPMGGMPRVGGVARNVEMILDQLPVFDFYEGGGPDCSVLSFAEIDVAGKVNVSRFGGRLTGCGGFPNIAHGARHLILAGTLTTGSGQLKLVDEVQHVTYDAMRGIARGQRVTIVTDEGVLRLTPDGFRLADEFEASERLRGWLRASSASTANAGTKAS
jgi:acyl CoA:acetate/3-ketoacid CoA transferase